jgi:hypothetical protein
MANGLNSKKLPSTSNAKPIPALDAGSYPARLVQILLMGIQKNRPYKGEEKAPSLSVRLTYEMLDEFMEDEEGNPNLQKPRWISEQLPFFPLKADLAKSTKRYYALDPESSADGDWAQLLSAPCMVTLVQSESKGKVYNNVAAVSAMRPKEAAKAPPLVNEGKIFDFYSPDMEVFKSLPDWLQEEAKNALDFAGSPLEALLNGGGAGAKKQEKAPEKRANEAAGDIDRTEDENW